MNQKAGLHLFNLVGFEVRLDLSWFVLAFLVCWTLAVGYFPFYFPELSTAAYWMMGIAGAIGLFLSIVLHELCHSLVGRYYGIPIGGITLFIFGGIAHMNDMPPTPKSEFFMAIVGPLFSIALAFALFSLLHLSTYFNWQSPIIGVIQYLAVINLVVGIFNLLPAFPLDGGRVFRSLLWWWKDDVKWATAIACTGGKVFGFLLMGFGVVQFLLGALIAGLWMFVLGFFIERISKMSYKELLIRQMFRDEPVKKYAKKNLVTARPDMSIADLMEHFFYRYYHTFYPVVESGRLLGCISLENIKGTDRAQWSSLQVRQLMQDCVDDRTVDAETKITKVLQTMSSQSIPRMLVTEHGKLYGMITLKDMMDVISLHIALEEQ